MDDILPDGTPAGDVNPTASSAAAEPLQLTPREIAIAKGENPDATDWQPPASESADDDSASSAESPTDDPAAGETDDTTTTATDDGAAEPTGETAADPTSPWYSDADLKRAERYGLDQFDLDGFSNRQSFRQAINFLDRQAARQEPGGNARKAAADASGEDGAAAPAAKDSPLDANGRVNLQWYRDNGYDEATVAALEAQQKQLDAITSQYQQLEEMEVARESQRYNDQLHDVIDSLGRDALYGKSVGPAGPQEIPAAMFDRRVQISEEVQFLAKAHADAGRDLPPMKDLVELAEHRLFAKDIAALPKPSAPDQQARLAALARQSKQRRPAGTNVSPARSQTAAPPVDPFSTEAIARHPDVTALFEKFEQESGASLR